MTLKRHGHWFCDHCDDVVFMSYQRTEEKNVPCPDCGYLACNFIPDKINRKTLGEKWFDAMRHKVAEAANPELPTMTHHKKLL